jgi:hypothetical protein
MDDWASSPPDGGMSVGRARVAVAGVVWLLVVAGASLVTWTVIDAAGRDVVNASAEQGSASPRPTSTSDAPTDAPTEEPTAGAPHPSTRPRVATWEGAAGSVVVRCRGPVASLAAATPADGWAVEVADRGPERVEVELRRDDPDGRARLRAECVRGIPGFTVDTALDSPDDTADTTTEAPDVSPSSGSSATQAPPSGAGADDSGSSGSGGGDHGRDDGGKDRGSDDH